MHVLWLGDPACHDRLRVGGKAAQLSHLAARHPVPPGFCLTATAFDRTRSAELGCGNDGRLPAALEAEVVAAYVALAERTGIAQPAVAVRSSAIDEDGSESSFAGQHETYLNVIGSEALVQAVMQCWASVHSERAVAYRRQHGLATTGLQLGVLVQQLIVADVSAVLFSANPITGNRDEIVITASWGLGESIVGGTVTPDTYVVRKQDMAVVSRQVAEKRHMTVATATGTREVEVPRLLRARPALTEAQAVAMARLGLDLEAALGWPVDVECAYGADQLYLLQCRPITTLAATVIAA